MSRSLIEDGGRADRPAFCFVMPYHISENRGGGAEVQAWFLACELARRGFRTSYIAQSVAGKRGKTETINGVAVHWVRYAHHFRWSNALAYYRALSRANADIVVQRMTAFTTGVAALWCRRRRRKFIWICSDNAVPRKWYFLHGQRAANRKSRAGPTKRLILLFNALITDLSRNWGMKHVSLAFTQNELQKSLLAENFGLDSKRMISGHPVPAEISPPEAKLAYPVVLWVAHLGTKKRPEKFIELARLAHGTGLRFVMIGSHSDASRRTALFADVPPNLDWRGKLLFDQTLSLFDHAAFFVNTSALEGEGFPNTFIQAWLRGVPVLSLEVDPDGVMRNNDLGLVDSCLDHLLAYMKKLISQPEVYHAVSDRVREYAIWNLSSTRMVDNFLISVK
jgi:glycosyltransferase involved in cell wall biosynthesis